MTGIVDGAIGRARMVLAILICAVVAGVMTYIGLPKEADPDIPIPYVAITVPLAGVTPEDAERLLDMPIEQEIQSIEGLKTFNGYGSEGAGTLVLEFEIDVDVDHGDVLLAGTVDSWADIPAAVLAASDVRGVRTVYSELHARSVPFPYGWPYFGM